MPVVDTCILSSLAKIDRLSLLKIFKDCMITPSVLNELDKNRIAGFKFVERIDEVLTLEKCEGKIRQISLDIDELKSAHKLREKYKLSLADCECIVVSRDNRIILLTDDTYLTKIAIKEGVEKVYDLKDLLGACILKGVIENTEELREIISLLTERDYYEFSEINKRYLFSLFGKR